MVQGAVLTKDIKKTCGVPKEGIERAVEIMESGKMYRYNAKSADESEVAALEMEFIQYTGHKYCVALNSCGSALFLALKVAGVQPGDKVLSNLFTFQAVPAAIVHAGGTPVYVDCNRLLCIDEEDLVRKAQKTDAKFLLLSHMRGRVAQMDRIRDLCKELGITLLEDCAHSLGVLWNGKHSGHHGEVACFSSQSYKMVNSGEGGFLCTNDDVMAAKAICYAGMYEKLYQKHKARPDDAIFEAIKHSIPNFSLRMSELSAAVLRPQMKTLEARIAKYQARYDLLIPRLKTLSHVEVPEQLPQVRIVPDSVQFLLTDASDEQVVQFRDECGKRGLHVEIFGHPSNARYFPNWLFAPCTEDGSVTNQIIKSTLDLRMPLSFEDSDFVIMANILEAVHHLIFDN